MRPKGIPVVKGHAYGNDFLLVPQSAVAGLDLGPLSRAMCHRQTGIGGDGLVTYRFDGGHGADASFRLFNADGSPSEMSGNGIRCLAALLGRENPEMSTVTIDTPAGLKVLELMGDAEDARTFRASMGAPTDIRVLTLEAAGERVRVVALSVGNPQCVLLENSLDESRLHRLGPALEHHPQFPHRTNVSFAHVETPDRIRILIWERGAGPTLASGTGACGAAVAAAAHGGAARDVEVVSPGGSQRVEWREDGLYLTGWAKLVFEGVWLGPVV
ncbi:MAG TPA: diaminopimelate epimerase [Vicinamibacterales bacterium]|nr:diaminopimelate epimerase [Vicinamibacterales bacterium]